MKNIELKELVKEVITFCVKNKVLDEPVSLEEIRNIERGLENPSFVERLIGTVMKKTRNRQNKDYANNKQLYLKLNALRFDLEFKDIKG